MAEKPKRVFTPPTFHDAEKRVWTIKLTLGLIDRVQQTQQIDLAPDDNDVSPITALVFSTRKLGAVLWECCSQQAESNQLSRSEFADGLDGEALNAGWGALVDAIIFFIQTKSPKLAEAIRQAIEAEMRVVEAGAEVLIKTMGSQETDKAVKEQLARIGKEMQAELSGGLAKSRTRSRG